MVCQVEGYPWVDMDFFLGARLCAPDRARTKKWALQNQSARPRHN